ncbi:hypothetical protein O988_03729 [Pseudogymnoascus sp. VKM F-3808]|nr:hypothetical protein O988_03729 [Pseudogymnoascus sp. VKM F-3808]
MHLLDIQCYTYQLMTGILVYGCLVCSQSRPLPSSRKIARVRYNWRAAAAAHVVNALRPSLAVNLALRTISRHITSSPVSPREAVEQGRFGMAGRQE